MLSSKSDAKAEDRFATRLDVLTERVDTLGSTVATTASALAKKDGEIAALQRALEARDQTLQALVQHVNRAAQAAPADAPVDESELRSLRNAVAALTKERAGGVNAAQIDRLVATVRALAERVDALAAVAAAPSAPTPDPALTARIDAVAAELAVVRAALDRMPEELVATLAELRDRVDGLAELEPGVTEEHLDERLTETKAALEVLPRRIAELAARVDSGTASLADKEQRLQALQRDVAETSSRIESVAGELREAEGGVTEAQLDERAAETTAALDSLAQRIDRLDARVESGTSNLADKEQRLRTLERQLADSTSRIESIADELDGAPPGVTEAQLDERLVETRDALEALAKRMDELASGLESATTSHADEEQRLEALHRQVSESSARIESIADDFREAIGAFPEATPDQLGELSARIEVVEKRVATVAVEVARAKTLWPVALRSLEARLDDVATKSAHDEPRAETEVAHDGDSSERVEPDETTDDLLAGLRDSLQAMETVAAELERTTEHWTEDSPPDTPTAAPPQAVAGGARVVPLRTTDP
jgi:DNA repair exonuclease SbcCD ATPase subunit